MNTEPATPPAGKRVWSAWATAGFGAVITVVFFLIAAFVMIIVAVVIVISQQGATLTLEDFTGSINSYMGLLVSIAGIIGSIAGAGLILAFIKARGGAGIAEYLGLRRINWKTSLVLIIITAGYVVLAALINYYFHIKEDDTKGLVDIYNSSVWPVLFWIAVVVFAPVFEEPFARGFLFEGFRRSRLGLIGAICLTSLIWTVLHVGYGLYSLGTIFVFGLVLGAVRYKTGSLWSTMLMHAFYNVVGMTLIALSIG